MAAGGRGRLRRRVDREEDGGNDDDDVIERPRRRQRVARNAGRPRSQVSSDDEESAADDDDDDREERGASPQRRNEANGSGVSLLDGVVGDVMRYVLFRNIDHGPCRSSDLSKAVLKAYNGPYKAPQIVKIAGERLNKVFGYDLVITDVIDSRGIRHRANADARDKVVGSRPKAYVLKNAIDNPAWIAHINAKDEGFAAQRGLLLFIYSILYLKNGAIDEASLLAYLGKVGLGASVRHEAFGSVTAQLQAFVKQQYLHRRKKSDVVLDKDEEAGVAFEYQVGPRGLQVTSKRQIREFLASLMGAELKPTDSELDDEEDAEDDNPPEDVPRRRRSARA
ncbi:unnamed protein product (mitochondrion) [Plasmodiophora brassicae]|uniref:MAGE domain-containing protein n=1 Tax=Plasmodiophora brassicae TaxID=37360 RepID=A0A0G4J3Q6_PLABS|nr:hypothetical protein PBRA_002382 [Plasmodiophora brassicae]SPQ93693.1 unnamed protein product [Plasmodiophora brassicae]